MIKKILSGIFLLFFILYACGAGHFRILPLGVSGGELENNLSSYVVTTVPASNWVALDAGTLCSAIKNLPAAERKVSAENFLQQIKAYFISHAHLDHISGLIICSPIITHEEVFARQATIDYLRNYIFNWKIWPNFFDSGINPLKMFHYHKMSLRQVISIPQTSFKATAFPLSHSSGYPSTAFLLQSKKYYLLYFGDTGADPLEHSHDIEKIWNAMAPLIKAHKLTAIFIETSFSDQVADNALYGHLKPKWVLFELHQLASKVNPQHPEAALKGFPIVITHIKQGLEKKSNSKIILQQLEKNNDLGVKFIVASQYRALQF